MGIDVDFILDCLVDDDDPKFWQLVCQKIFPKPLGLIEGKQEDWPVFMTIGACSRWLTADTKRFSDTHGEPLPSNSKKETYSRLVMPEYDWSVLYSYDPEKKTWAYGRDPISNHYLYRIALPAKTSNLNHATVLTHWEPMHPTNPEYSDYPQLYTFRKKDDEWILASRDV